MVQEFCVSQMLVSRVCSSSPWFLPPSEPAFCLSLLFSHCSSALPAEGEEAINAGKGDSLCAIWGT